MLKPSRGFKGLDEGSKGLTGFPSCDGWMEEGGSEVKGTLELVFTACEDSFLSDGGGL